MRDDHLPAYHVVKYSSCLIQRFQSETAMNNIYSKLSYGTFNLLSQLQAFYSPVWDMTLCSFILQVHLLLLASK